MAKGISRDKPVSNQTRTELYAERKDNDQIAIAIVAEEVEQEETSARFEGHASGDCKV